jgi:hypothetical protein
MTTGREQFSSKVILSQTNNIDGADILPVSLTGSIAQEQLNQAKLNNGNLPIYGEGKEYFPYSFSSNLNFGNAAETNDYVLFYSDDPAATSGSLVYASDGMYKFDLSNVTKIIVNVAFMTGHTTVGTDHGLLFGVSKSSNNGWAVYDFLTKVSGDGIVDGVYRDYELDVSALKGEYLVKVSARNSSSGRICNFRMRRLFLQKT